MQKHIVQPVCFQGIKTKLRPLCKETDLQACLVWMNDPEICQYLRQFRPIDAAFEAAWFDTLNTRTDEFTFAIETLEGEFIGSMGIHEVNWVDRTAVTGAVIGNKDYWGRGYGTDAKLQLLRFAFEHLNMRKLLSRVYSFNERSSAYNLHCGYTLEGRLRQHVYRNGSYHDMLLFGLFREEFAPIWDCYKTHGVVPKNVSA